MEVVFVTVHALFVYRQITYYFVNPYTFIEENFASSPDLSVNHLTNTCQTPLAEALQYSATMELFTLLGAKDTLLTIKM